MAAGENLDDAVKSFQKAEEAIQELLVEVASLVEAGSRLDAARVNLSEASEQLGSMASAHQELTKKLADVSKGLSDATDVVRRTDPSKIYAEIQKVRNDYQAQIERIGALGGDLKTRVESSGKKVSTKVAEVGDRMEEVMTTSSRRQTRWIMMTALIGVVILGLQVVELLNG